MGNKSPFSPPEKMPAASSSETDVDESEKSDHDTDAEETSAVKEADSDAQQGKTETKQHKKDKQKDNDPTKTSRKEKKDSKQRDRRRRSRGRDRSRARSRRREKSRETRPRPEHTAGLGSERPRSPPGLPKTGDEHTQSPAGPDKGKGKHKDKSKGKKVKCLTCGSRISASSASQDQHRWTSEYCITWQQWNNMAPEGKKKDPDGMWQRAKAIAREMKQERDLAAAAATETTGGKWDTASVVSLHSWMETNDRQRPPSVSLQSARGVKPASSKQTMTPEEPDRTPEPPAPRHRRRKRSSTSSPAEKSSRRSKRHNVVINIGR